MNTFAVQLEIVDIGKGRAKDTSLGTVNDTDDVDGTEGPGLGCEDYSQVWRTDNQTRKQPKSIASIYSII